jgi:hypothetical protein
LKITSKKQKMAIQPIAKYFESNLNIINDFVCPKEFVISGGANFWNSKKMEILKDENRFRINLKFIDSDKKYYQEVSDRKIEAYKLSNKDHKYYVPKKATHMRSFNPTNNEWGEEFNFTFLGEIDQIGSVEDLKEFDEKFHRLLIPFSSGDRILKDFQRWNFTSDFKSYNKALIKIEFDNLSFHLFNFSNDKQQYWGIDSLQLLDFEKFKSIAYSALNVYGFIKGNLYLKEAYYFASEDRDFIISDFHYTLIRDNLETGYRIFTTDPYSVYVPYHYDKGEQPNTKEVSEWNSELLNFSEENFSKLVEYFYKYEVLSRSALIILEANTQPLELKAASYCVAYEGICHTIIKLIDINAPSVIDQLVWEQNIKPEFENLLNTLTGSSLNEDQVRILKNKINNLNQPTNRDSLTAPFVKLGYNLSSIEIKCIDNRNRFLHGSLPVKTNDEDENFKELYFNSITIHKLIYILILKLIGFDGHIINYPKLHEDVTGKPVDEPLFLKI